MGYNLLLVFDLLHLVGLSLGPSVLLQMTLFHSFSRVVEHIWWSTPHILWFLKTHVLEGEHHLVWKFCFETETWWQLTCSASLIPGSQAGQPQIFNSINCCHFIVLVNCLPLKIATFTIFSICDKAQDLEKRSACGELIPSFFSFESHSLSIYYVLSGTEAPSWVRTCLALRGR